MAANQGRGTMISPSAKANDFIESTWLNSSSTQEHHRSLTRKPRPLSGSSWDSQHLVNLRSQRQNVENIRDELSSGEPPSRDLVNYRPDDTQDGYRSLPSLIVPFKGWCRPTIDYSSNGFPLGVALLDRTLWAYSSCGGEYVCMRSTGGVVRM